MLFDVVAYEKSRRRKKVLVLKRLLFYFGKGSQVKLNAHVEPNRTGLF